jgi:hypothetical protein
MFHNLTELSDSVGSDLYFLLAPLVLLWRVGRGGVLWTVLVPLVLLECVAAFRQRRLNLSHYTLLCGLPVMLLIYTDKGTNMNHLLDLVIVAVPVIGCLWAALPASGGLRQGLGLAVVWTAYMGWATTLVFPLYEAINCIRSGSTPACYAAKPLAAVVPDGTPLLCEDPWIALARHQRPCILDPYSLGRMAATHPHLTRPLIARVEGRQFQHIVLCQRLDGGNPYDRFAWEDLHFGRPLIQAIRRNYRLLGRTEDYYVYIPNEDKEAGARAER